MKINLLGLGAAVLAAGVLAAPAAAFAAEGSAKFAALTDPNPALISPGKTAPVTLGLANIGTAPADGVVVNIRVLDDTDLPRLNDNCRYYVDSNLEGAWCEIDGEVAVGTTYALDEFRAAAAPQAEKVFPVVFQWVSKQWADEQGGIEKLAEADAGKGETVVAGNGPTLRLVPASLTIPADPNAIGFARLKLITPSTTPTTSPTPTTPTTTAPTTAPAGGVTPSPTAGAGEDGGGLPVTGAKTATVAGAGIALLVAGVAGYVVARRRRTRFVA